MLLMLLELLELLELHLLEVRRDHARVEVEGEGCCSLHWQRRAGASCCEGVGELMWRMEGRVRGKGEEGWGGGDTRRSSLGILQRISIHLHTLSGQGRAYRHNTGWGQVGKSNIAMMAIKGRKDTHKVTQ